MGLRLDREQLRGASRSNLDRLARSLGIETEGRPKGLLVDDILRAMRLAERAGEAARRARRMADAIATFTINDTRASSMP